MFIQIEFDRLKAKFTEILREMVTVAIQGERGAYSEQAARAYYGNSIEPVLCENFVQLINAVEIGQANYGMLPIENSTAGSVIPAYDALINSQCHIIGEQIIPIHHCLLGNAGSELSQIRTAFSHPQALAQSAGFLEKHGIAAETFYDTAGSAKALSQTPDPERAAIASELAAEIYGLDILAKNIEDLDSNQTRFYALSKIPQASQNGPYKSVLHCMIKHEIGALAGLLTQFAQDGINLTKIESRPDRESAFHYQFILELSHPHNEIVTNQYSQWLHSGRIIGTWH